MKIKDKFNVPGVEIHLPNQGGINIPITWLIEMPRFHCKHYGLWNKFEFASDEEKKQVESMSLEEARQADMAELEGKKKALISTNVVKPKDLKKEEDANAKTGN